MLQVVFWGCVAYSAGTMLYKVGKKLNILTTSVFAGEVKK
jgi:hypothetical protein